MIIDVKEKDSCKRKYQEKVKNLFESNDLEASYTFYHDLNFGAIARGRVDVELESNSISYVVNLYKDNENYFFGVRDDFGKSGIHTLPVNELEKLISLNEEVAGKLDCKKISISSREDDFFGENLGRLGYSPLDISGEMKDLILKNKGNWIKKLK